MALVELYLDVATNEDGTFEVDCRFFNPYQWVSDAVLKLDYYYSPWPRYAGNLLW